MRPDGNQQEVAVIVNPQRLQPEQIIVDQGTTTARAPESLPKVLCQVGSRIHHFRKSKKMSQEKLAQSSGLDRAYISSVENGKQNVTIGALLKLSGALGIALTDLIVPENRP